jgi:hypothetical protein
MQKGIVRERAPTGGSHRPERWSASQVATRLPPNSELVTAPGKRRDGILTVRRTWRQRESSMRA